MAVPLGAVLPGADTALDTVVEVPKEMRFGEIDTDTELLDRCASDTFTTTGCDALPA